MTIRARAVTGVCCALVIVIMVILGSYWNLFLTEWYYRKLMSNSAFAVELLQSDTHGWQKDALRHYLDTEQGKKTLFMTLLGEIDKIDKRTRIADMAAGVFVMKESTFYYSTYGISYHSASGRITVDKKPHRLQKLFELLPYLASSPEVIYLEEMSCECAAIGNRIDRQKISPDRLIEKSEEVFLMKLKKPSYEQEVNRRIQMFGDLETPLRHVMSRKR